MTSSELRGRRWAEEHDVVPYDTRQLQLCSNGRLHSVGPVVSWAWLAPGRQRYPGVDCNCVLPRSLFARLPGGDLLPEDDRHTAQERWYASEAEAYAALGESLAAEGRGKRK